MQRILALTLMVLLAGVAFGQDYPRTELFTGFTYTRVNTATDVPSFSANGGGGQFAYNFNKWAGFVTDIGAVHNGNISDVHMDTTMVNFLFGPRISLRYNRITPYFNFLIGGVHAGTSIAVSAIPTGTRVMPVQLADVPVIIPGQPVTLRAVTSQTAFAFALGGGLDIKINKHLSFRPVGLDYFMTRLQNVRSQEDKNQDHIRVTTGFNFTFGAQ